MRHAGYRVEWKCYVNQDHWCRIPGEIDDIVDFIGLQVRWELDADQHLKLRCVPVSVLNFPPGRWWLHVIVECSGLLSIRNDCKVLERADKEVSQDL